MVENMNLIRKVAWSFYMTTGIDINELISEASVAYLRAEQHFDPEYGVSLTTYVYSAMEKALIRFCKKEYRHMYNRVGFLDDPIDFHDRLWQFDFLASLPGDSRFICEMILNSPHSYYNLSPRTARGSIVQKLREIGWTEVRIWKNMKIIKETIAETPTSGYNNYKRGVDFHDVRTA